MRLIIALKLKPNADPARFEQWLRETGLPAVRALVSVQDYELLRVTGLFGAQETPPYDYIGVLDTTDAEELTEDFGSDAIHRVMDEMRDHVEEPVLIQTELVSEVV